MSQWLNNAESFDRDLTWLWETGKIQIDDAGV